MGSLRLLCHPGAARSLYDPSCHHTKISLLYSSFRNTADLQVIQEECQKNDFKCQKNSHGFIDNVFVFFIASLS